MSLPARTGSGLSALVTPRSAVVGDSDSMLVKLTGWRSPKVYMPDRLPPLLPVMVSVGSAVPATLTLRASPGGVVGGPPLTVIAQLAVGVTLKVWLPVPPLTVVGAAKPLSRVLRVTVSPSLLSLTISDAVGLLNSVYSKLLLPLRMADFPGSLTPSGSP